MRICIDTHAALGHKTGIGHYAISLLDALRRVAPEHEYVPIRGRREVRMRLHRRLGWQQGCVPWYARRVRADLLHVPGFDAPRWRVCPIVLTVHDVIGLLFPANLPPISRFYWSRWLPRTVRWADRVITDSEHTRRDLIRMLGISPQRIDVVYLGVHQAFRPLEDRHRLSEVRHKYRLPPSIILYVGTLEPRKGLDTLIAAYAALASDIEHDLVIAGKSGWYTEPLFREIQAQGLTGRVHFTDYVADEDLPALYNAADLFVFPSRYEGFGLPPLEAMACGTPVVCSDASSLPEVVGDAALLVPPDDPDALAAVLHRVLGDRALQGTMRAMGLDRAGGFTWDKTARQTVEIYERLL